MPDSGVIRPWREHEWLQGGHITPAVAVVMYHQLADFYRETSHS